MNKPAKYARIADRGEIAPEVFEAMRLDQDNFDDVKRWCLGQTVWTDDPINKGKLEVGINFPGFIGMERLNEGEFLMKIDDDIFKRVAPQLFLSVYERI